MANHFGLRISPEIWDSITDALSDHITVDEPNQTHTELHAADFTEYVSSRGYVATIFSELTLRNTPEAIQEFTSVMFDLGAKYMFTIENIWVWETDESVEDVPDDRVIPMICFNIYKVR